MDETTQQVILICLVFAVVFGPLAARSSNRRATIYGGLIAQIFHFIGAAALVSVLPAVIAGLVLGGGFRAGVPVAVGLLVISLSSLVVFAIFEQPTLNAVEAQKGDDQGWTEEDARSSGL
jgi:hypothetical protein